MIRAWFRCVARLMPILAAMSVPAAAQSSDAAAMIAEVVRTGSVIVRGVRFDTGRTALASGADHGLAEVHAVLTEHTEWTFEVQVHTDETGDADADRVLSQSRAESIVAWLTGRGIAPIRLVPRGCGSSTPLRLAPVSDPSLQHRRVELRKLNEE